MIENIVFDMGNVLMQFDPAAMMERLSLTEEENQQLLHYLFATGYWTNLDNGNMTEAELVDFVWPKIPEALREPMKRFVMHWDDKVDAFPGMYEVVEALKMQGYGIYLLSNASSHQHVYWPQLPVHKFFDGTLISADVKMVKPDLEIYQCFLQTFDLKAESCVFIDDREDNIEAAGKCGITGIVFDGNPEHLKEQLQELLAEK